MLRSIPWNLMRNQRSEMQKQIIGYAQQQADIIVSHYEKNAFNIILGGDCSILIGNAIALKKLGNFGIFYLDGHTDFIPPETFRNRWCCRNGSRHYYGKRA